MANSKLPNSADEYVALSLELHRRIFARAEPAIAGRFRIAGETARFGREGSRYERTGVEPFLVESELRRLFSDMPPEPQSLQEWHLCVCLARFFERFFMIHPFVDGNGRVARLVAELITRHTNRWRFDQRAFTSKERDHYVGALEHAHKHTEANGDDRCDRWRRDALHPLAKWIGSRLIPMKEGWDLLEYDEGTPGEGSGTHSGGSNDREGS